MPSGSGDNVSSGDERLRRGPLLGLRRRLAGHGPLLGLLLALGCGGPARNPPHAPGAQPAPAAQVAPITNTDPCATRLHDICGPLLLYFAINHHLPDRLEDLRRIPGFEAISDLTCPVSHRPYVYRPAGMASPDGSSLIILYDPVASHSRMRWAVAIAPPADQSPLVTKVIAVQNSWFAGSTTSPAP